MTSNYTEQLKQRLSETPVEDQPFPHVVLKEVFTEEHYQLLLQSFMDSSEMVPNEGYDDRFVVHLSEVENWDEDGDPRKRLWMDIARELGRAEFTQEVFTAMSKHVMLNPKAAKVLEGGSPTLDLLPRTLLTRDLSTYFLGPHKDAFEKFATLLIYLPSAPDLGHSGTSFFEPRNPSKEYDTYVHHSFGDFKFVQEIPFEPNTAMMFLKTDNSFHGVRPAMGKVPPRDLIIHNFYVIDESDRQAAKG